MWQRSCASGKRDRGLKILLCTGNTGPAIRYSLAARAAALASVVAYQEAVGR